MDTLEDKKFKKVADVLRRNFALGLLAGGDLTEEDFDSSVAVNKKIVQILSSNETGISLVIDHRDEILEVANSFLESKKYDFAIIFLCNLNRFVF